MFGIFVAGIALGAWGYYQWLRNGEQRERERRREKLCSYLALVLLIFVIIIDAVALFYFLYYHTPPTATGGDSYASTFRRFVEKLLNLESSRPKLDYQFITIITILISINLFGLIGLLLSASGQERANGPLIHIGNNDTYCCSVVLSVGAAAVCVCFVIVIWYVYQTVHHWMHHKLFDMFNDNYCANVIKWPIV